MTITVATKSKEWLKTHRAKERKLVKDPKVKALRLIDMLTCNDDYANNELLTIIYKIAHSAHGICGNPHDDWKQEMDDLYKRLKDVL